MTIDIIKKVYFCPGARNHELLNLFDKNQIAFDYDERSASFKALGHSKLSNDISAVCTTSGTAVAECLPAMIEGYYSNNRLLLISADRPIRMRDNAAPQTINHELVTHGYRKYYKDLSLDEFINFPFDQIEYPAHLNVIIQNNNEIESVNQKFLSFDFSDFAKFCSNAKSPLFLISHDAKDMRLLAKIMKEKNIPFYAELLSSAHELSFFLTEHELLLRLQRGEFDSVIRIGHTPQSKLWRLMEKYHLPVFSFDSRGFTGLSYGIVMQVGHETLIQSKVFWEIINAYSGLSFGKLDRPCIKNLLGQYPESEPALINEILHLIPEGSLVYVGNSLSVRFVELVLNKKFRFFGNRGVNGIDGQISTAIGLANSTDEKVYCIVGDLTTFYDLGALSDIPENLSLIIINNKGGKIFETMHLSSKMCMNHDKSFVEISKAFNKSFSSDFRGDLFSFQIIEVNPNHNQTLQFLKELE